MASRLSQAEFRATTVASPQLTSPLRTLYGILPPDCLHPASIRLTCRAHVLRVAAGRPGTDSTSLQCASPTPGAEPRTQPHRVTDAVDLRREALTDEPLMCDLGMAGYALMERDAASGPCLRATAPSSTFRRSSIPALKSWS